MIRKLFKLVIVLVVLIIAGVVAAYFYIDTIAKAAVERGSTYALGVKTTLGSANVKIFDGQFVMKELDVANPAGYQTPHFLTLKKGDVAVTLASLREEIIRLPHLKLNDLDINLEKKEGKSNYQVILDNLKRLESGEKPPEDGKRYIINRLTIKNATVHVDSLGSGRLGAAIGAINVPIDEIDLTDVGSDTGRGVLLSELAGVILKAVLTAAINKGGDLIPDDILGDIRGQLSQLKDIRSIADVEKLGGGLEDIKNVGDKLKEGVGKSLGDLLGGEKNKQ